MKPGNKEFPLQLELFARNPDLVDIDESAHLTPIPVGDDLTSLSAVLMNDDYYYFLLEHSIVEESQLHRTNMEALICLKAKAYLEIMERISQGSKEDSKQIRKHKGDIFRLEMMLTEEDLFDLPENIHQDLQAFADVVAADLPDKTIFKEMGAENVGVAQVFAQLINSFKLNA